MFLSLRVVSLVFFIVEYSKYDSMHIEEFMRSHVCAEVKEDQIVKEVSTKCLFLCFVFFSLFKIKKDIKSSPVAERGWGEVKMLSPRSQLEAKTAWMRAAGDSGWCIGIFFFEISVS